MSENFLDFKIKAKFLNFVFRVWPKLSIALFAKVRDLF